MVVVHCKTLGCVTTWWQRWDRLSDKSLDKTHHRMTTRSGLQYQRLRTDPRQVMDLDGGERSQPAEVEEATSGAGATQEALISMLREQQKAMLAQQDMQREYQQDQQEMMTRLIEQQREEMARYRHELEELRTKSATSEGTKPKLPKPTLHKLDPNDDIEDFLATFEHIAKQQDWPKEIWATQLAGLLTGKAMAAYTALRAVESEDYKSVKKVVLHRYDVNEETHRLRFHQDRKWSEESFREWICRAADHFDCWVKDREIPLREMVIMEQVLLSVPEDLAVWLRERHPGSLDELGKLADDYVLARTGESVRTQTKGPAVGLTTSSEKQGVNRRPIRRQEECSTPAPEGGRARVNTHGNKQCFHCRQWGHLMYNCPNRKEWNVRGASKSALYGESCKSSPIRFWKTHLRILSTLHDPKSGQGQLRARNFKYVEVNDVICDIPNGDI